MNCRRRIRHLLRWITGAYPGPGCVGTGVTSALDEGAGRTRVRRRSAGPARRVGANLETDVAVIQVSTDGRTEIPFGDSDRLEVGDFVFAVGNPRLIGQTYFLEATASPEYPSYGCGFVASDFSAP